MTVEVVSNVEIGSGDERGQLTLSKTARAQDTLHASAGEGGISAQPLQLTSIVATSGKRRVALVTAYSTHYRDPLYALLARRFELECFFFSEPPTAWTAGQERIRTERGQAEADGDGLVAAAADERAFTRIELRRMSVLGQAILPGLARRLSRARYDAIVMDLTGRLMLPYVYAIARARHLPFVLWTGVWHHPTTAIHRMTRGVAESLYRGSDAIIVYGDHVRRTLLAVKGVENEKIFTAAQAVEASKFERETDVTTSRQLLFVGRMEANKGVDDLVAAFALVDDASARLTVVGHGTLEAELRSCASADPRVRFAGFVPQDELPSWYEQSRAFVLPSVTTPTDRECWGHVVNEAMHAGLPVIATDAVGAAAHGLVKNGVTGLVVPERHPERLGAAMTKLLADDALASALGRQARERVRSYTLNAMADAIEAAVEFGIERKGCPGSRST